MADSARTAILQRVRLSLGRKHISPIAEQELGDRLQRPPVHVQPEVGADVRAHFLTKLHAAQATVVEVASLQEVPAAFAAYLAEHGVQGTIAGAPALQELVWPEQPQIHFGPTRGEAAASITPCFAAVAETGSLVLLSGPSCPTTLNFLPDDHVIVVERAQIVAHIEDVWALLRARGEDVPRTINFITGPSRTADVEQTIQLGAHGPRRLHVILVG